MAPGIFIVNYTLTEKVTKCTLKGQDRDWYTGTRTVLSNEHHTPNVTKYNPLYGTSNQCTNYYLLLVMRNGYLGFQFLRLQRLHSADPIAQHQMALWLSTITSLLYLTISHLLKCYKYEQNKHIYAVVVVRNRDFTEAGIAGCYLTVMDKLTVCLSSPLAPSLLHGREPWPSCWPPWAQTVTTVWPPSLPTLPIPQLLN